MTKRTTARDDKRWSKVNREGPLPTGAPHLGPCWLWNGVTRRNGYGEVTDHGQTTGAHRWVYTKLVGPIPDGLELDHLCRVTLCVNPAHLEPVTHRENMLRGATFAARSSRQTHCKRGHAFDDANTDFRNGKRHCRACARFMRENGSADDRERTMRGEA